MCSNRSVLPDEEGCIPQMGYFWWLLGRALEGFVGAHRFRWARIVSARPLPALRSPRGTPSPQDVTRDVTRDLSALVGELAALKGDAAHWLTGPEYAALRHCLEGARRGGGAHRGQA
jgi:hypothetical protein